MENVIVLKMATHDEDVHGSAGGGGKTIFVRNLPYSSTNESLEKVFSNIGPVKQCFVVSDKDSGKCRGFGYIKFTLFEDAEKAVSSIKKVDGRNVHLMFANKKEKTKSFGRKRPPPKDAQKQGAAEVIKPEIKPEVKEEPRVPVSGTDVTGSKKKKQDKVKVEPGAHTEGKRARLIVRNLSFKCSDKQLKETFSKYGRIVDVHIPTKDGGKKLGFGFVQFSNKAEAGMAVKAMNGKPVLERKVAVDFTLPKEKYEQKVTAKKSDTPINIVNEDAEESMIDLEEKEDVKDEPEDSDMEVEDFEDEESEEEEEEEDDNSESEEGSESEEEEDKENGDDSEEDDDDERPKKSNRKFVRKADVGEGRTLFVRNVPYDIPDEEIEEYFSQFGDVQYARCVVDHDTGMSKGTCFVQFASKESTDICLKGAAQTGEHQLGGRDLLVTLAVDRTTASDLMKEKEKLPKDSRNLYLAREGMIRPGTDAAKDVPAADLGKRLKNDAMKRRKLKDQNTFISSTRLCFHNLPATLTDKSLKDVILDGLQGKKCGLQGVKIMRDLGRVNSEGVARSRGYGFVSFLTHETALTALNHFNNNAEVFGPHKRPIVEFSIENRKALQTKEKRLEKAKMRLNEDKEKEAMRGKSRKGKKRKAATSDNREQQDKVARSMHSGPLGLPRHSGAKKRHKPRPSQTQGKPLKKPKGFVHPAKANPVRRQREAKPKQETSRRKKTRTDTDSFDKLVAAHKKNILSASARRK